MKSCEIPEGYNFNAVHSSIQCDELLLGTITAQISAWHMTAIEDLDLNISEQDFDAWVMQAFKHFQLKLLLLIKVGRPIKLPLGQYWVSNPTRYMRLLELKNYFFHTHTEPQGSTGHCATSARFQGTLHTRRNWTKNADEEDMRVYAIVHQEKQEKVLLCSLDLCIYAGKYLEVAWKILNQWFARMSW